MERVFFDMSDEANIKRRIAKLYPQLSSDEVDEVETTLRAYLTVVKRIFDQQVSEKSKVLTELRKRAKVRESGKKGA
jgi:hypothetical protein